MTKNNLYLLCASFNGREKKHFKEFINGNTKRTKHYMHLFSEINTLGSFTDEKELKYLIKNKTGTKNFSHLKKNLYNKLLVHLRSIQTNLSVKALLYQNMMDINIMFNRGLYGICNSLLTQSEVLATKTNNYYSLLEIYKWQLDIIDKTDIRNKTKQKRVLLNKLKKTNKQIRLTNDLALISFQIRGHLDKLYRSNLNLQKVKAIYNKLNTLIQNNTIQSFELTNNIFVLKKQCFYLLNDYEQYKNICWDHFSLFKKKPLFKQEYFYDYLDAIVCNILSAVVTNDEQSMRTYCSRLDSELTKNKHLNETYKTDKLVEKLNIQISFYSKDGKFDMAEKLVDKTLPVLKSQLNKIQLKNLAILYNNMISIYMATLRYAEAIKWSNKFTNDIDKNIRIDLHNLCYFIRVVCYFELRDIDSLEYALKNWKYFASSRKMFGPLEKQIFSFFTSASNHQFYAGDMVAWKKLRQKAETYNSDLLKKSFMLYEWIEYQKNKNLKQIEKINIY